MDERLRDYDVRQVTSRAIQHTIDQISRYLITTENDLNYFTTLYATFLEDKNLISFWKEIEKLSCHKMHTLEKELLINTPFAFNELERQVLAGDNLSPHGLLFRMMEVAKLQRKEHVYAQLLPLYQRTISPMRS
jgi:hypothetical protein